MSLAITHNTPIHHGEPGIVSIQHTSVTPLKQTNTQSYLATIPPIYRTNYHLTHPHYDSKCGVFYRKMCFSSTGIYMTLFVNLIMALLNSAMVLYEISLMFRPSQSFDTIVLPVWYIGCDVFITTILFLEVSFSAGAGHPSLFFPFLPFSFFLFSYSPLFFALFGDDKKQVIIAIARPMQPIHGII